MTARRTTALPALALLATLVAPTATAMATTTDTAPAAGAAGPAETRRADAPRTKLTFEVEDCEGCELRLTNARSTLDADVVHVWQSQPRTVEQGEVTFRVATRRTWGMSVTVEAPWEGHTGYLTTVAWRYSGEAVGDRVTLAQAVDEERASACWEGTRRRSVTMPLVVEQVEVDGVHERVPGSIAFVPITQSWLPPMREVWGGVLGSQDVNVCR